MNSFEESHKHDRAFADRGQEARLPNMAFESERLLAQARQPFVTQDFEKDTDVIDRVKHTMHPGEKLGQWYARTLCSRAFIMDPKTTAADISRHVQQAEASNEESGLLSSFTPRAIPSKFILD